MPAEVVYIHAGTRGGRDWHDRWIYRAFISNLAIWQYDDMASRKLTFTLPQDLAVEFLRRVPPNMRSQYVATAISDKLREREAQLVQACEAANKSTDVREIESSFDALADESDAVREPW